MVNSRVKDAVSFLGLGLVVILFVACSGSGGSSAPPPLLALRLRLQFTQMMFNLFSTTIASAATVLTIPIAQWLRLLQLSLLR